ncbi:MAG: hypothetical protein KKC79_11140, partial [Gammaproteobacteria bacterium]|nr:hypothetical protein [Gammaproteobacteria bacterium]
PAGVPLLRWLGSFPSYGFVLSVRPAEADAVLARFASRGIAAAAVGTVDDSLALTLARGDQREALWDLRREAFIGQAVTAERPTAPETMSSAPEESARV